MEYLSPVQKQLFVSSRCRTVLSPIVWVERKVKCRAVEKMNEPSKRVRVVFLVQYWRKENGRRTHRTVSIVTRSVILKGSIKNCQM